MIELLPSEEEGGIFDKVNGRFEIPPPLAVLKFETIESGGCRTSKDHTKFI